MELLDKIKKETNINNIEDNFLLAIICEMGRYYDKKFTDNIQSLQIKTKKIYASPTRKKLRKKFYYGKLVDNFANEDNIELCDYSDVNEIINILNDFLLRLNTYDKINIVNSIYQKKNDLDNNINVDDNIDLWLQNYNERRKDKKYSLTFYELNQKVFEKNNYNENILFDYIYATYNDLENYRHMAIIINGEIYNQNKENITWKLLYKANIYAENFIQFTDNFLPFRKNAQIDILNNFLKEKKIQNSDTLANDFYKTISTGYQFEDCYISTNQKIKILIYQKIELDNSNVPCPSCNTIIQNGNSYPKVFLKSWECKNPNCPDRSKSGRGRRFDEYGVYHYFKLVENNFINKIDNNFYSNWRKDIFDENLDYTELLIKEYTYDNENILSYNIDIKDLYQRNNINYTFSELVEHKNALKKYEDLPIIILFNKINNQIQLSLKEELILNKQIEIYNGNSSEIISNIKKDQIGNIITSPPYYNAREYSQWNNLILYLIDMMINAKIIFNKMKNNGYYLYNIGDIVGEDNVYINSKMSHRRLPLGFLSCMIFEIIGYNLIGNKIWDKGEVQSRRNSTINLFSGYVKCINCYEHILIFKKGQEINNNVNTIESINPVIKINNRGQNTYGHTAPYPLELVDLIKSFINENDYILDPYLGSGTTLKWCKQNKYKGIGIELNKDYYNLCLENIKNQD